MNKNSFLIRDNMPPHRYGYVDFDAPYGGEFEVRPEPFWKSQDVEMIGRDHGWSVRPRDAEGVLTINYWRILWLLLRLLPVFASRWARDTKRRIFPVWGDEFERGFYE